MEQCDLIISNALIIDGSGAEGETGSVAIKGGKIAAVGDVEGWAGDDTLDAAGLVLAPGFIDVHTHDDMAALKTPDMTFKVSQGVTTVVAGNCGISVAPFTTEGNFPPPFPLLGSESEFRFPTVDAYRKALQKSQPAVNLALLAGHSSLRVIAMKDGLDRGANEAEIAHMRELLNAALKEGCVGFSTGLGYPPAMQAPEAEITALASVLREHPSAVYATHMRDEGDHVVEAVEETLRTGRDAGVPVVISHHKCAGRSNYGRSGETLKLIDEARAGQAAGLDVYPYTASSTVLLPEFVRESDDVLITFSEPHPEHNGRRLEEVMAEWECDLEEVAERLYPAGAIYFQMDEEDLKRILAYPPSMVGSDGLPGQARPHPRLWGTFPRVLGRYVREMKLLSLAKAIHKMTGLSAKTFGLSDRGLLREGYAADLVLFDPETIEDAATFEDPEQPAAGISKVWVGGTIAWDNGAAAGSRNGEFLTH